MVSCGARRCTRFCARPAMRFGAVAHRRAMAGRHLQPGDSLAVAEYLNETGAGTREWRVVNDLERLDTVLARR